MIARFTAKKVPAELLAAMAASKVIPQRCKARSKSKAVTLKSTFSGSVLNFSEKN